MIKKELLLASWLEKLQKKWDNEEYYYDVEEATKVFKFVSKLTNDRGASRQFELLEFQFEIITEILCVKRRSDGKRKHREAHINIPRKNGKSFLAAIIVVYLFFCQRHIFGALFILTANTTKQAGELYATVEHFIKTNKTLRRYCKITSSTKMFLNQHVALDHEKGAINMDLWDTCTKKVDTEDLKGWKCWGGLDLSSKNDITGFVLVFYEETTGRFIVVPYLYTPKETVAYRQHKDNNPYEYWIKKGDLIALDGKYINFDRFLDHATELDETYRIEQIGFDQWGSQTIINRLEDRWEVIPLGQGTKTMTQVINDFENLLVDERIIIAENECFRFMAKNCIAVYDEMLGVKYSKKKSKFKIDGIIAMLMGLLLCIEENGIEHYNPVEYLDAM